MQQCYLVICQYIGKNKIKLLWFLYNFAFDNQSDMEQRNEQLKCMVKKIVCATTAGKLTLNFTVNQIAPYKYTSHFSFFSLELTFKNVVKRWNKQWNAVLYFSLNFPFVFKKKNFFKKLEFLGYNKIITFNEAISLYFVIVLLSSFFKKTESLMFGWE